MALDTFMKLGDLKGESRAKGFEEQIEILSWSWGMSQTGTTHVGTGGGAGKVNVQDLSFSHYVDSASPGLIQACCTGKHFPKATLTMRKAGDKPLEYVKIEIEELIITSVQTGGQASSDERLVENVTVNFSKFKYSYQPQDVTGAKKGGAIEVAYDIAANA